MAYLFIHSEFYGKGTLSHSFSQASRIAIRESIQLMFDEGTKGDIEEIATIITTITKTHKIFTMCQILILTNFILPITI